MDACCVDHYLMPEQEVNSFAKLRKESFVMLHYATRELVRNLSFCSPFLFPVPESRKLVLE